jgi:hypothetical protein
MDDACCMNVSQALEQMPGTSSTSSILDSCRRVGKLLCQVSMNAKLEHHEDESVLLNVAMELHDTAPAWIRTCLICTLHGADLCGDLLGHSSDLIMLSLHDFHCECTLVPSISNMENSSKGARANHRHLFHDFELT